MTDGEGSGGTGSDNGTTLIQETSESVLTLESLGAGSVFLGPSPLIQTVSIGTVEFVSRDGDVALVSRSLTQLGSVLSSETVSSDSGLARGAWTLVELNSIPSAETLPSDGSFIFPGILAQIASIGSAEQVGAGGELIPESVTLYITTVLTSEALSTDGAIHVGAQVVTQTSGIPTAEAFSVDVGALIRTKGLGRRPLLPLSAPFDQLTPGELAAQTGVHPSAFRAFNVSVPHWRMERDYRVCAAALGLDPYALRAALRGARNKIAGRRPASNMASSRAFGGMKP